MTEVDTYNKIGAEFDRLFEIHEPLITGACDEFRADWLSYLESQGVTDEEWTDMLERRLDKLFKRKDDENRLGLYR